MDITNSGIEPQDAQQAYLDFKKIVDKYFSADAYVEGIFDSSDMASAIEEMETVAQKLTRVTKGKKNENPRDTSVGI